MIHPKDGKRIRVQMELRFADSANAEAASSMFLSVMELMGRDVVINVRKANGTLRFDDHATALRWLAR